VVKDKTCYECRTNVAIIIKKQSCFVFFVKKELDNYPFTSAVYPISESSSSVTSNDLRQTTQFMFMLQGTNTYDDVAFHRHISIAEIFHQSIACRLSDSSRLFSIVLWYSAVISSHPLQHSPCHLEVLSYTYIHLFTSNIQANISSLTTLFMSTQKLPLDHPSIKDTGKRKFIPNYGKQ